MEEIKYKAVARFPTLIARSKGYPAILIPGYRPYDLLTDIIQNAFGKEKINSRSLLLAAFRVLFIVSAQLYHFIV